MEGDALQDHRPRLRPLRQRAPPPKRPHHQRGAAGPSAWRAGAPSSWNRRGRATRRASKEQVLAACQDRMSTRGIRRTFAVGYETLRRWVGQVGQKSGKPPGVRGHAPAQPARRRARTRVNSGAACGPKRRRSGGGWRFVGAPAKSWPGTGEIAVEQGAGALAGQPAACLPGVAPPAAIFGGPTKLPSRPERTVAAARKRAEPATSNAGLARCASASAAWFAKPCASPGAPKTTWMPSTCSLPPTTSPPNSKQQRTEHYPSSFWLPWRTMRPSRCSMSAGRHGALRWCSAASLPAHWCPAHLRRAAQEHACLPLAHGLEERVLGGIVVVILDEGDLLGRDAAGLPPPLSPLVHRPSKAADRWAATATGTQL